jgi:hypothetical protein
VKENEPGVPGEEDVELKNKDEDDEADDEEEKSETVQPKRENRRREGLVQELIIISVSFSFTFVCELINMFLNN